ncbi:hypothetical protein OOK31_12465 [Streptomyces sp. NBC_00249]|uniref:effector-associated constant component EACC1 n=1 Tax=Streptomyces sp. NBC_00249 TaxID=2975690 RepID=UPI0022585BD4|nr:hypothetical protein [Streptomyces sp. NBC_00249]MCX5194700.1 hypothetical protein [Streptomyces sp. NBC_00249]
MSGEEEGAMRARVRLTGDGAAAELADLAGWLSREDEFRGRATIERPSPRPDEMGALADVLVVALGAGGAGTALAASLSVWIRHRRPSAEIEVTGPDGRSVRITVRDVPEMDVEAVVRRALER